MTATRQFAGIMAVDVVGYCGLIGEEDAGRRGRLQFMRSTYR
jgi:hypothetical protein